MRILLRYRDFEQRHSTHCTEKETCVSGEPFKRVLLGRILRISLQSDASVTHIRPRFKTPVPRGLTMANPRVVSIGASRAQHSGRSQPSTAPTICFIVMSTSDFPIPRSDRNSAFPSRKFSKENFSLKVVELVSVLFRVCTHRRVTHRNHYLVSYYKLILVKY